MPPATPAALRRPAGFLADWADPDRGDGRQRVARMAAEEHLGAPLVEEGFDFARCYCFVDPVALTRSLFA